MWCLGVEPLLFGALRLFADRPGRILPVGDLEDEIAEAIEVAGVIKAAGTELAADRQTQQQGEQLGGLTLGAVAA